MTLGDWYRDVVLNVLWFVSQNYSYTHLSAGDLLREERAREGSEFGQLIANYIKEGKIVPVEITINLLKKVFTNYGLWFKFVVAQRDLSA